MKRKYLEFEFNVNEGDEIVVFDKNIHSSFNVDFHYRDDEPKMQVNVLEFMVWSFFLEHANCTWNKQKNTPDHEVALRVSTEELADLFEVDVKEIAEALDHLLNYEYVGVVFDENNDIAYHVVL